MKNFFALLVITSFSCSHLHASQSTEGQSKAIDSQWQVVGMQGKVLRNTKKIWQRGVNKVIGDVVRLKKIKRLKKELLRATVIAHKFKQCLTTSGLAEEEYRQAQAKVRSAKESEIRTAHHKFRAYKTTMVSQLSGLQQERERLEDEYCALTQRAQIQQLTNQKIELDNQRLQESLEQEHASRFTSEQHLVEQLKSMQSAHKDALLNHQATTKELDTVKGSIQQLHQQLQTAQAAKSSCENDLRSQLNSAQTAHTAAIKDNQATLLDLNAVRATVAQLQQELKQVQGRLQTVSTEHQESQGMALKLTDALNLTHAKAAALNAEHSQLQQQLKGQTQVTQKVQADYQGLQTQLTAAQTAQATAAQNHQTTLTQLNTVKASAQLLEYQIQQTLASKATAEQQLQAQLIAAQTANNNAAQNHQTALAAKGTAEQQLRTQLTAAQTAQAAAAQNHQTAVNDLNTAKAAVQTLQGQLQQTQAAKTTSEQQLRTQLTTAQAAHTTATQNYQTTLAAKDAALNKMYAIELNVRAQEKQLRDQLAVSQAAQVNAVNNYQTTLVAKDSAIARLTAVQESLLAQLATAQATIINVQTKAQKFRASFITHYDHYYRNYGNTAGFALGYIPKAIVHTLHKIMHGLPVKSPVKPTQLNDGNNAQAFLIQTVA